MDIVRGKLMLVTLGNLRYSAYCREPLGTFSTLDLENLVVVTHYLLYRQAGNPYCSLTNQNEIAKA